MIETRTEYLRLRVTESGLSLDCNASHNAIHKAFQRGLISAEERDNKKRLLRKVNKQLRIVTGKTRRSKSRRQCRIDGERRALGGATSDEGARSHDEGTPHQERNTEKG